jgi:flagella basal body P-ring formation protein FlgA
MNKNAPENESLEEEIGKEETQDQPLDHRSHSSKSKPKKRRPKRGGCVGGLAGDAVAALPGETAAGLAGVAMTGLAGDAMTGLHGDATTGLYGNPVVKSTKAIGKGAIISKDDVELVVITSVAYSPDMLTDLNQAVGKKATRRIRKDEILVIRARRVVRSTEAIRKGATISKDDVELVVITNVAYFPDMLRARNQAVGKKAKREIRKGVILDNTMLK